MTNIKQMKATLKVTLKSTLDNFYAALSTKKCMSKILCLSLVVLTALQLYGCDQAYGKPNPFSAQSSRQGQIWDRVRNQFEFKKSSKSASLSAKKNPRIQKFVKQFHNNKPAVQRFAKASPYLHYIIGELEKRNMPGELALLPMLESSYEPTATSSSGAAGLWQFVRGTGRTFGLKQDGWYDGRRDVRASTHAALNYLQYLHKKFHGDWMLALAAYNAGEGAVQKAISRKRKAGGSANYWSLSLPKQTQAYVPKLLAMAEVVENPNLHKITLPRIENRPYFVEVNPKKPLQLNQVAKLANLDVKEVKRLNAGYKKNTTHPKGPQHLLLPLGNASKFLENIKR